jgi:hypothetical protein
MHGRLLPQEDPEGATVKYQVHAHTCRLGGPLLLHALLEGHT